MQKMAQAMPPLMKVPCPLTAEEEVLIGYSKMDAGRKRYVCGPDDGDEKVLSHVFVDESLVISAGAKELWKRCKRYCLRKMAKPTAKTCSCSKNS
jgi:hypothetical protein